MSEIKLSLKDVNILYQFGAFDWMNLNEYKGLSVSKSSFSELEMFTYS